MRVSCLYPNLEHEHLIRSYAAGECTILNTEMLYLAMELAESSLDRRFEQGNFQSPEIRQILAEVVSALAYLHGQRQVHRDLKPANILRARNRWKLSDFGLVKRLDSRSYAQTSNPIGTIAYMPPEAFEGNISAAWDMWSLGIMLVQMVTNRLPYQFNEPTQLLKRVMNCELNLPSLPDEFKPIILGCLQKDRTRRWTANQVLKTLQPPVIQFATPQASPSPRLEIPRVSTSPNPPVSSRLQVLILDLPNNIKLEMIKIPAGSFLMGSADNDPGVYGDEKPQHQVNLQEYYLGKYAVTQEQYQAVMGNNPSHFKENLKNPVESISWNNAKAFCQKVYEKTGQKVRLPTEAEWEYGCRAGTTTPFYFGKTISTEQANYDGNSTFGEGKKGIYREKTTAVGSFPANKFGLYDMHGNVSEWCEDNWHESYKEKPENLKQNGSTIWLSSNESRHVLRGGSWFTDSRLCRSAVRIRVDADYGNFNRGFRLALGPL